MSPVIPMMLGFTAFGIIFPLLVLRHKALELRHQERMEAMERGLPLPVATESVKGNRGGEPDYLLRGLRWTTLGLALTAILFFVAPLAKHRNQYDRIHEVRQLADLQYSKDEIRVFLNEADRRQYSEEHEYRAIASLGLLPTAVGVAYLIFYYERRRQFAFHAGAMEPPPVRLARADQ